MRAVRFCSVVFSVTSSLAATHAIHGRPWLFIARDRAWSSNTRSEQKAGRKVRNTYQGAVVIDRKARYSLRIEILAYGTCIRRPRRGGFPSEYFAMPFGVEKLECLGYPTVKIFWRYLYSFRENVRTWRTDTQTDTAWRLRPRLMHTDRQIAVVTITYDKRRIRTCTHPQYRRVTDGQTDGQTSCHGIVCAMHRPLRVAR